MAPGSSPFIFNHWRGWASATKIPERDQAFQLAMMGGAIAAAFARTL